MNATGRLVGFLGVLALVSAGAAVVGGAVDPDVGGAGERSGHVMQSRDGHPADAHGPAGKRAVLRFTVWRAGQVVHTEPYLNAGGHLVALREGDLGYLHTHPAGHGNAAAVPFETEFPRAGRYRLYFQFQVGGRVHTAEFTRAVVR